ncbi:MAG: DegT/DnrJ/EryC1/StrS family aminotransferase [Armatimonadetes bacterium]|nr:DegT/DnrJ/EryC1/StrS family aminotransferase [Armatimonadota bacterium]
MSTLALRGGPQSVTADPGDMFTWPIITDEDEQACLDVLRRGGMSGTDVTEEFEREFAEWHGMPYCVAQSTGTGALQAAMWALGVRIGDEVIGPSLTYWASVLPAWSLGASIVFCDIEPHSMCLDPVDLEKRITPRTKVIIPVHYCGYPCDMDAIMAIAAKHGIKVLEDVSHAHGAEYKGRLLGTIGDCAAMSVMSGKALPVGEGGFVLTRDKEVWERVQAWGLYERTSRLETPELKQFAGLPWGGYKYRMHQLSSAVGRVQLRHYRARMVEIQKAMNYFWDLLEGVPGVRAHRPPTGSGSHCGGWYACHGLYVPEELDDLPIGWFCRAVTAEGVSCGPGANMPLHLHPLFHDADVYGHGKPTAIANADRDLRAGKGDLPVTEAMPGRCYWTPWFKHYRPEIIEQYANAYRKAAEHAGEIREHFLGLGETPPEVSMGSAGLFLRR